MKYLNEEGLIKLIALIKAALNEKADLATTVEEYGITNVYTKGEIDELVARLQESEEGHFFKAEDNRF